MTCILLIQKGEIKILFLQASKGNTQVLGSEKLLLHV